jgi:acetyl-CoA carboxylase biotin carboxyl carrier protein
VDLKEIKSIIDLMKKNSLSEFELEEKDFKIKLKRPIGAAAAPAAGSLLDDPELTAYAHLARPAAPTPAMTSPATAAGNGDAEIKSPMIGTFYRTPSPDAAPYVEVGSEVGPDTVVCIIEAMKVSPSSRFGRFNRPSGSLRHLLLRRPPTRNGPMARKSPSSCSKRS